MNRAIKGLAYEGKVNVIVAETTQLVEYIRNLHDLTPTTTAILGRVATMTGIMGLTDIKDAEDSITIQINGNGPVGTILSTARRDNETAKIKSYLQNSDIELPLNNGKISVGQAVGKDGFLNIIRKNEYTNKSYTGLVNLVSGEIAEDFTEYYAKSKQVPTVIALGVLVDQNGVRKSGGYMINLMPDATEIEIEKIEKAIQNAEPVTEMLEKNMSLEDILRKITGDEDALFLVEDLNIEFECDCSKDRFKDGLASLGKEELEKIFKEDGKINVKCHFCNKEYEFLPNEII